MRDKPAKEITDKEYYVDDYSLNFFPFVPTVNNSSYPNLPFFYLLFIFLHLLVEYLSLHPKEKIDKLTISKMIKTFIMMLSHQVNLGH